MSGSLRPGEHIQALDGIRGLAIILVVAYHLYWILGPVFSGFASLNQLTSIGWIGVDLFFVLSGFLITGILIESKSKPHYYRRFYIRRALRIFPLYYGGLIGAGVAIPAIMGGERASATALGYYGFFLANWAAIYIRGSMIPLAITHFWSLCVEEQFYLVWPACVARFSVRSIARVSAAMIVSALLLRVFVVDDPTGRYILTVCRMDALAIGAFLAAARRLPDLWEMVRRHYRWAGLCAAAGFAGICLVNRTSSFSDPGVGTVA